MKTEYKIRMMTWAIVILAIMNLSTILTIVCIRNFSGAPAAGKETESVYSESESVKFSGRYFRDHLDLDRGQMAEFGEFNPTFRLQVRNINICLNRIREQMLTEMSASESDTTRLDHFSDSVGNLHADLKKLTYRYYLDLKRICNIQQQDKLEQLFGEVFASDVHSGQSGLRGPYGKGRGRRFFN